MEITWEDWREDLSQKKKKDWREDENSDQENLFTYTVKTL